MKSLIFLSSCIVLASAGVLDFPALPIPDGRIVGGEDADISDFPYQVSMQRSGMHVCGGAIIAKNWIITAAHCLQGYITPSMIKFRAGSAIHNRNGVLAEAAEIFNHPDYNPRTMANDVALVRLKTDLVGDNIEAIDIVEQSTKMITGRSAIVSGWGYLSAGSYDTPSNLQYVQVKIIDQDECHDKLAAYGGVRHMMFCAADTGKDSCQGDSGGPIVDTTGVLIGVVSWGVGCAAPRFPGVYTRLAVPGLRTWVRSIAHV